MSPELQASLRELLKQVGGIDEAHAPAFKMDGDDDQTCLDLFILVARGQPVDKKVKAILAELGFRLPPGTAYRVWAPSAGEPIWEGVRSARCQLWPYQGVETITLQKETPIEIGRPANPLPTDRVADLGRRLARMPGIQAAYLPMISGLPGQPRPAQVLVLQLDDRADWSLLAQAVGQALELSGLTPMDCLPQNAGDALLSAAKATECVVPLETSPGRKESKWWRR